MQYSSQNCMIFRSVTTHQERDRDVYVFLSISLSLRSPVCIRHTNTSFCRSFYFDSGCNVFEAGNSTIVFILVWETFIICIYYCFLTFLSIFIINYLGLRFIKKLFNFSKYSWNIKGRLQLTLSCIYLIIFLYIWYSWIEK